MSSKKFDTPSVFTADQNAQGMKKGLTSYGDSGFSLFLRKAFIKGAGYTDDALDRPVIGITNTGGAYNACHGNMPQLIEAVKRGVMLAGGLPMDFPTISIHESFAAPTSMHLRNLMSMDTEEMIRAQPMDAVVMIGGCDKTVPAQLMGAASAGIPSIQLVTGAMLTGSHRSERVGACTDCRRFWAKFRAEEIDAEEIAEVNNQLVASVGTCSVMGTASTMACVTEALGMMVPGGAAPPAVTAERLRVAERTGATAVAMAKAGLTPDKIMTKEAFENAFRVLLAIGGSTNGIIHLTAVAGRLGIDIDQKRIDELGRETPVLIDLKPSGQYYMEDLNKAGAIAPFHLAFPVRNLTEARAFYGDLLGCPEGRSSDEWIDFDFFGHQIVAHLSPKDCGHQGTNGVDSQQVPVRHFGVVLSMPEWESLTEQLRSKGVEFGIEPYIRFKGLVGEQGTMFFYDPSGNALEFKAFNDINQLFAK